MVPATSIEFIENIGQYEYEGHFYDFHNDYVCEKMVFTDQRLFLVFRSLKNGSNISLKFTGVKIEMMNFFNVKDVNGLTLDTLYRGRVEGLPKEGVPNRSGYFYLEFYEGQKLEFWAEMVGIG